jgi:hypothetical protein
MLCSFQYVNLIKEIYFKYFMLISENIVTEPNVVMLCSNYIFASFYAGNLRKLTPE